MPGPSPLELAAAESLDLPPAGNEALRRQWRFGEEGYRARWESVHAGGDANAVAYDLRGNFLAIGTRGGEVRPEFERSTGAVRVRGVNLAAPPEFVSPRPAAVAGRHLGRRRRQAARRNAARPGCVR